MNLLFFCFVYALFISTNTAYAQEKLNTFVKTGNETGWTFNGVYDKFSQAYVDYASQDNNASLELGAGRGATAAALVEKRNALNNNAELIINDLSSGHLIDAKAKYPILNQKNVKMSPGKFPKDLNFENGSFNTILASRLFHFLTPEQWRVGLKKIYVWLNPGGRFYITTGTYWVAKQKNNIKNIELKKQNGDLWPAVFKSGQEAYGGDSKSEMANLVDRDILIRELKLAGFEVVYDEYIDGRKLLPASFCLDGKEGIGAIAIKPFK